MNPQSHIGKIESSHKGLFWGWYVVSGAFIMLALTYGARYSFGVFVQPLSEEYGWSMSVISFAATLYLIMDGIGGILCGRLLDLMAPRWIMTAGVLVSAFGFWGVSIVHDPVQFYLFYGILCGLGGSCFSIVICSASVGKWFVQRRGTALGIATMGIGLGTLFMSTMSGFILKYSDWRIGFLTIGGAILVVGILVSQILMGKSAPEEYSLYPDGRAPDQCFQDQGCEKIYTERASIWPVIKDAQFWILVFCCSTASLVALMMLVHQVPHALRLGIDNVSATTSLGIVAICGMFGRFFFGWLSDRLKDPKYAAQLGFLIMTAGLVIMSQARSLAGLYLYAVVFGFGYGSIAPLGPVLIAHRFGRQILGSVFGVFSFFWVGLAGIGPLIGGSIFDLTGSYYLAWWVNIVLLMVLIAILFFLKGARSAARR